MTEDEFWDHIRASRRKDCDAHCDRLTRRLAKRSIEEIADFNYLWNVVSRRAYLRDLWGAAYLLNGGCSDDGFEYFRGWLILQGRTAFEAAVRDPDTLAAVVDPGTEVFECECRADLDAYFAVSGRERDDAGYASFESVLNARQSRLPPLPELAPRWDFDDDAEVRRRFPRLAAMFLSDAGE